MATTTEQEFFDPGEPEGRDRETGAGRRRFLAGVGAGALALGARMALGQDKPMAPPSVVTTPPRDFGPGGAPNVYFWDADVLAVDPSFNGLAQPNAPIQRLWGPGALWAEGPAWNSVGKFLVWSDIPNNRQLRWIEDDGHVSVFRSPSNNSNGNLFDFQGRQVSFEHLTRRVVRYELDGSITVLADNYKGKRLNSPNDGAPHPDGSIWFTDPPYGAQLYEGTPDPAGGKSNKAGKLNNRVGQPVGVSDTKQELPTQVYRWDPSGRLDAVIVDDKVPNPNGLCFSPDYKKLYVSSTGPAGKGDIHVLDVGGDNKLSNQKVFTDCKVDGVHCGPDGFRSDVFGNLWCASNAGRAVGYSGVTVWSPEGKLLGRIRLPEICGNVTFGGPKRNRLFMVASQSLFAVYTATQGASPS
ncbi:MAG TPA: SMP-30/gluconolactonase/LRE family protein [Burkholderiales bacterium]|jgi:gluconolactonase|nr:SMP-30/gluconolactonase/LRE family protein [Burkholderiales bacterium]